MKLLDILKNNLILEVSEKIKKQLLAKWSPNTDDSADTIIKNIDLFDNYKSGLPADKRDIMRYTYDELKDVISSKQSAKNIDDIFTEFKKKESKLDNNQLRKYIKKFLEIQQRLNRN